MRAPLGVDHHVADHRVTASLGEGEFCLLYTSIVVAGRGSYTRCMGWPALLLSASDAHPWLQGVRWGIAAFVAVTLVTVVRSCAGGPARRWGQLAAVLFGVELVLAVVIRISGLTSGLAAWYSVAAVALLCCLAIIAALGHTRLDRSPAPTTEILVHR